MVKKSFSHSRTLRRNDPRREKYRKQRKERGFDDSELWSLDETIIAFTLPRLRAFRDYTQSFPLDDSVSSFEDWQKAIDKMIFAMENYGTFIYQNEVDEGIDLFLKYFKTLWT